MQVTEQKNDCQLTKEGQEIDGLLHLIEVRYSDRVVFWTGVWEMTTDQAARIGVLSASAATFEVRLSDGRQGYLTATHILPERDYFQMAGVGKPTS